MNASLRVVSSLLLVSAWVAVTEGVISAAD
jgi:hypothetical protein